MGKSKKNFDKQDFWEMCSEDWGTPLNDTKKLDTVKEIQRKRREAQRERDRRDIPSDD